ncbi:MAG: sulfite exporter TauE/SafE family protein [Planctomycetota bacterium]|jgi:uncharacterized membrane protein YfcA
MDVLPLLLVTVLLAGFTQGAVGFAFGMICMAILPLALDVEVAVPVVAILGLLTASLVLYASRAHADPRKFLPLVLGGLVGTPLGVAFLTAVDARWVLAALGVVLSAYAGHALFREWRGPPEGRGPRESVGNAWGAVAGTLGGMLGAAFNIGGPPAILFASARGWSPGAFRANLQIFFLSVSIFQLALLAWKGWMTPRVLQLGGLGLLAVAAGVALGHRAARRLDEVRFRRLVLVLLLGLGAFYLGRTLT